MLRISIKLPIKRLVRTVPDRSLTGPGILEMAKDRRPDCGCGPVRSCDFRSWLVRVWSSPGLFPVLGPDFQTLLPPGEQKRVDIECWVVKSVAAQIPIQICHELEAGAEYSICPIHTSSVHVLPE